MNKLFSSIALAAAMMFAASVGSVTLAQTGGDAGGATGEGGGGSQEICNLPWVEADANGDGAIAEDEATVLLKNQFATVDTNGDGAISPEEYEECRTV